MSEPGWDRTGRTERGSSRLSSLPGRWVGRIAVAVGCTMAVVACGGGGGAKTTTTLSIPATIATTSTTVPQAAVEVRPPSGQIGTSFQLVATKFQPGEMVTFEIDFPGGKVFKGKVHTAAADGSVTAPFTTAGNPAGIYQVKATGDKGTQAAGQFEITGSSTGSTVAGQTTTTVPGHTNTTGHTTTTAHTTTTVNHTTTTKKA